MASANLNRIFSVIAHLVIGLIIANFLFSIIAYYSNIPYANDDTTMFLRKYMRTHINTDSNFLDSLKYLFSTSVFPHAKFIGRSLASILNSLGLGVNYGLLKSIGQMVLLSVPFIYYFKSKAENIIYFIPVFILLLTPIRNNIWVGPITGYPYLFLFVLIAFDALSKRKTLIAGILAFVISFTHSPGLVVFPVGFLIIGFKYWDQKSELIKQFAVWFLFFIISLFLYYQLVIIDMNNFDNGKRFKESGWPVNRILSLLNYFLNFSSLPTSNLRITDSSILNGLPVIGIFTTVAWLVIKSRFKEIKNQLSWFGLFLFSLAPAALGCLSNDNPSIYNEIVAPRYIMYSVFIWVSGYVIIINANTEFISNKFKHISVLLLSIVLIPFLVFNSTRTSEINDLTRFYWGHRLTGNEDSEKGNYSSYFKESQIYHKAINSNLYKTRKGDFSPIINEIYKADKHSIESENLYLTSKVQTDKFVIVEWMYYGDDFEDVRNMSLNIEGSKANYCYLAEEYTSPTIKVKFIKDLRNNFGIKKPRKKYRVYRVFAPIISLIEESGSYTCSLSYQVGNKAFKNNIDFKIAR